MKLYEIFYFGLYYYVYGEQNYQLIKSKLKSLKAAYKRDSFALYRFMESQQIKCEKITSSPRKTSNRN